MPNSFSNNFDLSLSMQNSLKKMRFESPTEVQSKSIAPALSGKDLFVQAPTGTGKTAAFGIPLIENIKQTKQLQGLVLCPTRELAIQTCKVLGQLAQGAKGMKVTAIYGGESMSRQFAALRAKPQIVVATPGRLLDHLKRKSIQLNQIRMVVLDEADRMLDMGFRDDLQMILSKTPKERQTLLFSATMSKQIKAIAQEYQKDPQYITVAAQGNASRGNVQQFFAETPEKGKLALLKNLLSKKDYRLCLIFVNTKVKAVELTKQLEKMGFKAAAMHGQMRQFERDKIMRQYRNKKFDILVATDVAARGVDIKGIDSVINYDLPLENENYVHRIGRTGRAEQNGIAYTFVCPHERGKMKTIARITQMKIEKMPKQLVATNYKKMVEKTAG